MSQSIRDRVILKFIFGLVLSILVLIIVIPLFNLMLQGFHLFHHSSEPLPSGFSVYIFKVTLNTLFLALFVTIITLILSVPASLLLSKFDIPWAPFWMGCLTIPLISPAFISGFAIVILFGKSGVITLLLEAMNFNLPSIYGLRGLILTQVLHSIPYAMLIIIAGLKGVPRNLEEVSLSFGSSLYHTQRRVVIPYIRPYILMAGLMVFLSSIGDVGGPLIVGGQYHVLSTEILSNYVSLMGDERITYIFVFWIIIISFIILFIVNRIPIIPNVNLNQYNDPLVHQDPLVSRIGFYLIACLMLFLLLPYAAILVHSFATVWSLGIFPEDYTWEHYKRVYQHMDILGNTLLLTILITPVMIFLGVALSYIFRYRNRNSFLNYLTLIPFVLPGVVFGISLLKTYSGMSINRFIIFKPLVLLVFAISIRRLPFVIKALEAGFYKITRNQEEVARGLGADSIKVLFSVMLPQLKPVIPVAVLISIVKIVTELSASIVINPPGWQSISLYITYYVDEGMISRASAMSIVLILVVTAGMSISTIIIHRYSRWNRAEYSHQNWGSILLGSTVPMQKKSADHLSPGFVYKQLVTILYRIGKILRGAVVLRNSTMVVSRDGDILYANKSCLQLIDANSLSHLQHATSLVNCIRSGPQLLEWIRINRPVRDFSTDLFTLKGERICLSISTHAADQNNWPGAVELFLIPEGIRKRNRKEFDRLKELADAAELRSLKAQINPHFLFNTLNGIVELIDCDPQQASKTTQAFADMFRYVLMSTKSDFVSLSDEILHISRYLEIEKVRFHEKLKVEWSFDESLGGMKIPPMIIQPIVENAIHHGCDENGCISIQIVIEKVDHSLNISIGDNGVQRVAYKDLVTGSGTGLQNVDKRLKTIYGKGLQFYPNSPCGLKVTMCIDGERGLL